MIVALHLMVFVNVLVFNYGANILGVFPIGGASHWLPYENIMKALAAAGHNVTVITSHPQKKPIANYRDIDISSVMGTATNSLSFNIVRDKLQRVDTNFKFIMQISRQYCKIAHNFTEVKELLSGKYKFDVVFTEIFGSDCDVGFAWKLNIPLISAVSSKAVPWAYLRMGNPFNPSYMHSIHVDYSKHMTFFERLKNVFAHLYYVIYYDLYDNEQETNTIMSDFFGHDTPPASEIVLNTSLIFINSHHTLDGPVPLVPNIIEIGGIHIKEPDPLPTDIQKFMDGAKEGVIYFTLGSLVRVSTLPSEMMLSFRDAFSKLPQRVLWKYEHQMNNTPPNVLISKWFPQKDILSHPNLKMYITHGGHMGVLEAIHNGVPLVGIPLFFDQHRSIKNLVDKGVAVSLQLGNITEENVLKAVTTILSDTGYAKRMKTLSTLFKDRPMTPAETVVYWTEYVIRHKGAPHLKSVAVHMPWYQYLLIDVISFLLLAFIIGILIIIFLLLFIYKIFQRLFKKTTKAKSNVSKKKLR